jgi:N-methylhydantoinase B
MAAVESVVTGGSPTSSAPSGIDPDPITTQVVRHGLISAAEQMKRALERTAFSPIIYETYDFAAALYDRDIRMLAQAESLAAFMGTMSFCVEGAVEAVGGEEALDPGDIIFYNWPYGTGSHQQDCAVIMPVFAPDGELVGYSALKAHFLDMGAKEPWCTDTTDVFQEGTIFPGVKMYARGELVQDLYRMALANSRLPRAVAGDINAEVVAVRTGAARLLALVERYGRETFSACVERMFDHGEQIVRHTLEQIPDGVYRAGGQLDSDGIVDEVIQFEVVVEVRGSTVRVDLSDAPAAVAGPINSPLPNTVSFARVTIAMLAGAAESPNEGFFRPLEIVTRPGSLFHAVPPAPVFQAGWAGAELSDVLLTAVASALPDSIPACNGGLAGPVWWGQREATGEMWADGYMLPVGLGASRAGDGGSGREAHTVARMRVSPVEVSETKNPWLFEKLELAQDSGGAGRQRGGLGCDFFVQAVEPFSFTAPMERTKRAPWGLEDGGAARSNLFAVVEPDGRRTDIRRGTGVSVPRGATLRMMTGGGGGFGPAAERDPEAVRKDLREGLISERFAREHFPHAFGQAR